MADNIIEQSTQEVVTQTQPVVSPEIAEMMAISLNNGIVPPKQEDAPQVGEKGDPEVKTDEVNNSDTLITPSFDVIKEKFNYQNVEDAIKEIEELRGFKANPSIDLQFENEFSEKLFKAIKGGKIKEVNSLLSEQERIESLTGLEVSKDTAADIIKLGMQLEYKDLTKTEIDYRFNKQFGIPKEPVQLISEEDDDFALRHSAWKEQVADIEMNRIIEAKLTKPKLESAKSKIVLPEVDAPVDEGYIQYKKMLEDQPKIDAEIVQAYKAFTPKAIETKMNFNDEANKVSFEFQYEPDAESFNRTLDMVSDINKFFDQFKNQDGTPDRKRFLSALDFALNKDKYLMEAMKQSKNATLKSRLPDNSQGGMKAQIPQGQQELSEVDKQMRASLAGFQNF